MTTPGRRPTLATPDNTRSITRPIDTADTTRARDTAVWHSVACGIRVLALRTPHAACRALNHSHEARVGLARMLVGLVHVCFPQ